ncbi:MAG: cytochrome C [Desulfobacterales bacterium]|nr:cytochrome C [Desulfobacterales bacterium]
MKKKAFLIALAMATLFVAAGIYAATTAPDVIELNQPAYKHKKGIISFSHKKHAEEYKATCGDCHHDAEGKPRADLKDGDDVKGCFECHNKPGELKGKKAKGLSDKEKRAYHANALHDNCKGCHKDYNKKNKTKAAPTTCTKCHPKK